MNEKPDPEIIASNESATSSPPRESVPVIGEPAAARSRESAAAARTISKLPLLAAAAHGFYFLVTGLWPIVSLATFEAVSGRKTDHWLVITVGWLIAVMGLVLVLAAVRRRVGLEMFVLGIAAALALAGVDVFCWIKGKIPAVYLLDAVAEMLLVALWFYAAKALRARKTRMSAV